MKGNTRDEFTIFQRKITARFCGNIFISALVVTVLYLFLWKRRLGDLVVGLLEWLLGIGHEKAFAIYHENFRGNREIFFAVAILLVLSLLLWRLFRWMSGYFKEINEGMDALLADGEVKVCLSPEMLPFQRKLNAVKQELERRKKETALAEQRKDELVMYLAHDIRTPLTSVIGYLNLLEETPEFSAGQWEKYLHTALEKAYRLAEMLHQLFEITRYNSHQIKLVKAHVDLSLLLTQLSDELAPSLSQRGNTLCLLVDKNLVVSADADKLARVFGNLLKNAAVYSDPETEIKISAQRSGGLVRVLFQNQGADIPAEELPALFDKFYRMDKARVSDTGGAGLGLAIAKEIVLLHGGRIGASSEEGLITFTIELPGTEVKGSG